MAIYTIQCNYKVSIPIEVEADDEGVALAKARELAEDAELSEFSLGQELDSVILSRN